MSDRDKLKNPLSIFLLIQLKNLKCKKIDKKWALVNSVEIIKICPIFMFDIANCIVLFLIKILLLLTKPVYMTSFNNVRIVTTKDLKWLYYQTKYRIIDISKLWKRPLDMIRCTDKEIIKCYYKKSRNFYHGKCWKHL